MTRNLDIACLRTFVAVVDHAGMTTASNALHLTQSAVSQQIARLEELAGPVLVRERRGIRLTVAGERLLPKARRLVSMNDDLWSEMELRSQHPVVRLGAPHDLVGPWLTPILKCFSEMAPSVEIALTCLVSPHLSQAVDDGTLDLALVEKVSVSAAETPLKSERLVWVGAKDGAAHGRSPLPISLIAEDCAFRPAVLAALEGRSTDWHLRYNPGSIDATFAMVRADLAITTLLRSTVPADLAVIPAGAGLPELPRFSVNLLQSKGQASPATLRLARHIEKSLLESNLACA